MTPVGAAAYIQKSASVCTICSPGTRPKYYLPYQRRWVETTVDRAVGDTYRGEEDQRQKDGS